MEPDGELVLAWLAGVASSVLAIARLAVDQVIEAWLRLRRHRVQLPAIAGAALDPVAGARGDLQGFD